MTASLPSSSHVFRRWLQLSAAVSFSSVGMIAVYLLALLRMPPDQLHGFAAIIGVAFVAAGGEAGVSGPVTAGTNGPSGRCSCG